MTDKHELRKRWVEALRSGQYEQARGCLKSNDGYCCLGVAAEVAGKAFQKSSVPGYEWGLASDHGWLSLSFLSYEVCEAYGLRGPVGDLIERVDLSPSRRGFISLGQMNDQGYTFAEIADFIEQNPGRVFVDT